MAYGPLKVVNRSRKNYWDSDIVPRDSKLANCKPGDLGKCSLFNVQLSFVICGRRHLFHSLNDK
jgi:hypothetical protein